MKIHKLFLVSVLLFLSGCNLLGLGGTPPDDSEFDTPTRPTTGELTHTFKTEGFKLELFYEDAEFTYFGTMQTPTPCSEVQVETLIAESFPEQVSINFTTKESDEICIQVIGERTFSGTVTVDREASFSVRVNGQPISEV
ncbi:MAG: hypothetical protein ACE5DX_01170 [Candidatus Dojkabacteria bacterium]